MRTSTVVVIALVVTTAACGTNCRPAPAAMSRNVTEPMPGSPPASEGKDSNAELREEIRTLVRTGFHSAEDIAEIVGEELYEPGTHDAQKVAKIVASEFAALRQEQESWPRETDCDRLDQVFAALNRQGVIALQNAGITQSDGYDDVREIYQEARDPSRFIGYCFYHGQDLESAVLGQGLHLAFGPMQPENEESDGPKIGALIVKELERKGFKVRWDGTFKQRIFVEIDWKKRIATSR